MGYEPSIADAERVVQERRVDAEWHVRDAMMAASPTESINAGYAKTTASGSAPGVDLASPASARDETTGAPHADRLADPTRDRDGSFDRLDPAAASLSTDRPVAGRERTSVADGVWHGQAKGDVSAQLIRENVSSVINHLNFDRREHLTTSSARAQDVQPQFAENLRKLSADRDRDRDRENEAAAELFVRGAAGSNTANPRLSNAYKSQAAMERHIAEVFRDMRERANAVLESRQMIAGVLRHGLDVTVGDLTQIREIKPIPILGPEREIQ